jgi:hypothetical protein
MILVYYRKRIEKIVKPLPCTYLTNDADPESRCTSPSRVRRNRILYPIVDYPDLGFINAQLSQ